VLTRSPAASRSAIGLLKLLLVACVAIPILLFGIAAWLNYKSAITDAERDLLRTSEVAREQAAKIFEGESQVADRVNDLVRGLDASAIAAGEKHFHDAFGMIVGKLPQVQSVMVAGIDGTPLASAGTFPVPRHVDLRPRDYFRAVLEGFPGTYISGLQVGDVNRQLFFGLAQPWKDAAGALKGVIDVAVSPSYFEDFYGALVGESQDGTAGKVLTLVRDDGQILVRYPPIPGEPPQIKVGTPFFAAIQSNPDAGLFQTRSIIDPAAPQRVYAYRRVQGYPLYVVAGRSQASIMALWRRRMMSHLVFGLPVTVALFAVTWTALVRTRREMAALDHAHQEMQRRERAEAALLRSQRLEAVGQMTGGVAHDFNNLLTVILGSAELLANRADDPARVRRLASQIIQAAQHGGKVTQQLLTFSRRQLVHPETVDLNALLLDFRQLLERAASEAVKVVYSLAPQLDPVQLDPGHFEAAILNLVGNARDAMPNGGTIRIATRNVAQAPSENPDLPPGAYVRIVVADNGSGMDPATAAKAFEPFFTTKEIGKGTGLGLSQVYGFAKQAGGDVRILTAPGRGTAVKLLLPRSATALEHVMPAPQVDATAPKGAVVLVVEDEDALRDLVVESLAELGYIIRTAATAQDALVQLRGSDRVDILFSDVVMPGGMTGLQLSVAATRLRPGLKVLLTSGYSADAGMQDTPEIPLLTKPYNRETLARSLRQVLHG
jgi:two-component system NtrC family sensor kinase